MKECQVVRVLGARVEHLEDGFSVFYPQFVENHRLEEWKPKGLLGFRMVTPDGQEIFVPLGTTIYLP